MTELMVGGISIEGGNPVRTESAEQALALDRRLREVWGRHPRFTFVPHSRPFFQKITFGLAAIQSIVTQSE